MILHGLNKLTLLDYPGHLACTVFAGSCNFRCPFCHNASLVLSPDTCTQISEEHFFTFLRKRRGILEGVCVTGGEPTLQKDLPDFLSKIKELGFLVKLDTNGYKPKLLEFLLRRNCVDMVSMDIKNCPERYDETVGLPTERFDISRIFASTELLRSSRIPYEFRTTVIKELHPMECFSQIGEWLAGSSPYFLQQFVTRDCLICGESEQFHSYTDAELRKAAALLSAYLPNTHVRGDQTSAKQTETDF